MREVATMSDIQKQRTYQCWQGMKQRCHNPNSPQYKNYGARGITVCDEWRYSFLQFLADMGEKPDGRSLDRINNDAGYSKENCRWATPYEQRINQRTCNYVSLHGRRIVLREAAKIGGITEPTLLRRIRSGMSVEEAISLPVNEVKQRAARRGNEVRWTKYAIAAKEGKDA